MPKESSTIRVMPSPGEPFVYLVESWENPQHPHRCELLNYFGNGECSCTDFSTRCAPNWKQNGGKIVPYGVPKRPNPKRTRCKHLTVAVWYWANNQLAEESAKQPHEHTA